jgi:hypothetical protein
MHDNFSFNTMLHNNPNCIFYLKDKTWVHEELNFVKTRYENIFCMWMVIVEG